VGGGKVPDDWAMGNLARQLRVEAIEKLHRKRQAMRRVGGMAGQTTGSAQPKPRVRRGLRRRHAGNQSRELPICSLNASGVSSRAWPVRGRVDYFRVAYDSLRIA
jgi:hypothetical protein